MIRLLIAFALLLAAPAAALGQERDAAPGLWTRSEDRIAFTAGGISFPRRAGATAFTQALEFSRHGEGVDNILQYVSQDRQVFATVYIYLPGLPHAGLTAFMTDQVIRGQSDDRLRAPGARIVGAGGHDGVAIRSDYTGFRGGMASSAAFIKLDRWIVKLRVSAPDARRGEADAAMTALLDGLRIDGHFRPRPAASLEVADCPLPVQAARVLQGDYEQLLETALLGMIDGNSDDIRDRSEVGAEPLPPRIGRSWCLSTRARVGNATLSILRAQDPADGRLSGRSVLLVPVNDAGTTFELLEIEPGRRYSAYYHEIGRTAVLGSYDGPLSDEQVVEILSGADRDGNRVRASIDRRRSGDSNVNMPPPPAEPSPPEI